MSLHRRLPSLLHAYAAGDLPPAEAAEIERRIATEPKVAALFEQVRSAHEALLTLRDRPDPEFDLDAILPRIRTAIARERFEGRPVLELQSEGTRLYRRLALAASILCALSFALFAYNRLAARKPPAPQSQSANESQERPVSPKATPEHYPTPRQRGMERLVDAGQGEVDGAAWARMLRDAGLQPGDTAITPTYPVVPVSEPVLGDR